MHHAQRVTLNRLRVATNIHSKQRHRAQQAPGVKSRRLASTYWCCAVLDNCSSLYIITTWSTRQPSTTHTCLESSSSTIVTALAPFPPRTTTLLVTIYTLVCFRSGTQLWKFSILSTTRAFGSIAGRRKSPVPRTALDRPGSIDHDSFTVGSTTA